MTTRTILRVKRKRNEQPITSIRLEGLDGRKRSRNDVEDLSSMMNSAGLSSSSLPKQRSTALWKRVEGKEDPRKRTSFRLVDAFIEEEPIHKRRRLTLTEVAPEASTPTVLSSPKKPYRVLDPLSRLVDDSLQSVHTGNLTVAEHYRLVTQDPRLAHETHKWIAWRHSMGGNLLHACAVWNQYEIASEILQSNHAPSVLLEALDGDGRTPYEVAELSGHEQVCRVLEAFGGDATYVYDLFYLEDEEDGTGQSASNTETTVELQGGVGYWTPEGELVLEAEEPAFVPDDHDDGDEDDDEDSNCEGHERNDYPDEEGGVFQREEWGGDWAEDNDSDEGADTTYRNQVAHVIPQSRYDDGFEEDYDASFGLFSQQEGTRQYAFDPQLDLDSE